MREAIDASQGGEQLASSASYAHFLKSRLLHHAGQHAAALDELRLAQVTHEESAYLGVALAEEHARVGDLRRAERELKRVIERSPSSYEAQLLMGRVLLESRRYTRAKVHLRKALRLRPREPEAYLVLSHLLLETDEPDAAMKTVESLGKVFDGAEGFRRLGLAFAARGDLRRAEQMLVKSTQRHAADVQVLVSLASIYEATGRVDSAERMLALALELRPDDEDLLINVGRLALQQGGAERAKAYLDRLLLLADGPEAVVRVAFLYLGAQQVDLAADVLDRARASLDEPRLAFYSGLLHERQRRWKLAASAYGDVQKGELVSEALERRARTLSLAGQHASAFALFEKAIGDSPGNESLRLAYAQALQRAGSSREAEGVLRRALETNPSPRLLDGLADVYAKQARFDDAVALLTEAIADRPDDAKTLHYSLGTIYERRGDSTKALAQMRRVLELDPADAAAMNFIGYTLAEQGQQLVEAERLISAALELRPDSGAFYDSLGWVSFRRGDFPRAIELLLKASQLAPGEPVILEHLGDAYRALGRREEAKEAFLRALELVRTSGDGEDLKGQRKELERKLKLLSSGGADR